MTLAVCQSAQIVLKYLMQKILIGKSFPTGVFTDQRIEWNQPLDRMQFKEI